MFRVFLISLLICTVGFSQTNRYSVKSGFVEYDILGEGLSKDENISGTSSLYFKDFGNIELIDERIVQVIANEPEEERVVYKIIKDRVYTADFNDEITYSQKLSLDDENPLFNIKNRETFTQMGAKFLGNENILGYKCDVWELGDYKIWVYNSVMLKQISKSLGKVQLQIAKSANFNINIKEDKFKLPNFPIKAIETIIGEFEEGAED